MGDLKVAKYLSHSLILNRICDCHQRSHQINAAKEIYKITFLCDYINVHLPHYTLFRVIQFFSKLESLISFESII
jgi:hypothetical protein